MQTRAGSASQYKPKEKTQTLQAPWTNGEKPGGFSDLLRYVYLTRNHGKEERYAKHGRRREDPGEPCFEETFDVSNGPVIKEGMKNE